MSLPPGAGSREPQDNSHLPQWAVNPRLRRSGSLLGGTGDTGSEGTKSWRWAARGGLGVLTGVEGQDPGREVAQASS